MNVKYLILLFPVYPLLFIFFILTAKYIFKKNYSALFLYINNILQIITGIYILYYLIFINSFITIHLSSFKYTVIFSMDENKIYFLIAYLIPLCFSFFKINQFKKTNIKIIFLFFLCGSSGLIVTGDLFNFYVFYELMIMNAYILISMEKKYYASFKYMIFGVLSSVFFLFGIMVFYTYSGDFNFFNILDITTFELNNFKIMILFFLMAFLIKGGFFPVSSWVATCHSAPKTAVSSFLSSYTITSGIRGLFYLVIIPVIEIGWTGPLYLIRILAVLTFLTAGVFTFFEKEFKRCVALSTCFAMGIIGYLLTYELYKLAFLYMIIHSFYKSTLFYLIDDISLDNQKLVIFCRKTTFIVIIITVFFTAGFFPSLTYFINKKAVETFHIINFINYSIMIFILSGFLKFRFIRLKMKINYLFYLFILGLLILAYYYFYITNYLSISNIFIEFVNIILFFIIYYFSRLVFNKFSNIDNVDTSYVFKNLNYDIMYILLLFICCMIVFAL